MEINSGLYTNFSNNISVKFRGNNNREEIPINSTLKTTQTPDFNPIVPDYNIKTPAKVNLIEKLELPNGLEGSYYKLSNGQKVVIVPKQGPTVIKTYVNTGSMNEPDNIRGISHFIEHNLFNGSEALAEQVFFDEVSKLGAHTNASTSFSQTDYFIESGLLSKGDLEKEIKLHAGMIQSPKFLTEKLEKEKDIVNSEINMYMSNDESVGYSNTIKNLFNIKTNSNDLIAGTTDNITKLKREDVINYFNDNYYPSNMVTVVTGNVDENETIDLISKYFNSNKTPKNQRHYEKLTPIEKSVRNDIISQKTTSDKTSIFIGFAGPENNNHLDNIKMEAINTLLVGLNNSRFSEMESVEGTTIETVKERIGTKPFDNSMIMYATKSRDNDSEKILQGIYKILNEIVENPPTEYEMEAIKNALKKGHSEIFEISHDINQMLGKAFMDGNGETLKDYNKIVDSLTSKDLVETAKKYLNLNKASITVIHPQSATEASIFENYKTQKATKSKPLQRIDTSKITQFKLKNNAEIILNDTNSDNMQINFRLTNSQKQQKNPVFAPMLSLILENGGIEGISETAFANIYDKEGIDIVFRASEDELFSRAEFPKNALDNALSSMTLKLNKPNISDKNFEKAKQILMAGYMQEEPQPYDEYFKEMFPNTASAATVEEKINALKTITKEDIENYYNDLMENVQVVMTASGPFNKYPELKEKIVKCMSNYADVRPLDTSIKDNFKPIEKTKVFTQISTKNQAEILEGFKFKDNGNIKDCASINLLNKILGGSSTSRLFNDLREQRHLAYTVNSMIDRNANEGVITLKIKTTTQNMETGENTFDNVKKSIDGFNENIQKLLKDGVTQEELDLAKKKYKSDLMSVETNRIKNNLIHNSIKTPYGLNFENEKMKAIDEVTLEDINNAIQNIFNSKPIYSITASKDTIAFNKEFLENLSG